MVSSLDRLKVKLVSFWSGTSCWRRRVAKDSPSPPGTAPPWCPGWRYRPATDHQEHLVLVDQVSPLEHVLVNRISLLDHVLVDQVSLLDHVLENEISPLNQILVNQVSPLDPVSLVKQISPMDEIIVDQVSLLKPGLTAGPGLTVALFVCPCSCGWECRPGTWRPAVLM